MSLLQKFRDKLHIGKDAEVNPLCEIFAEIPTLETERLILRRITPEDAQDMYDYSRRSEVTRFLLWDPHPDVNYTAQYLLGIQEKYRKGEFYDWAIEFRADHRMIGTCGFTSFDLFNNSGEIGYVIHPQYGNMGIAPEAADRVLTFGFESLHLHRIEARYLAENVRSRRVMEKCGMHFEGINKESILQRGVYRDAGICAVLRDEYRIGRAIRLAEKNTVVVL